MTYFPFMAHAFAQMRQWRHYAPSGIIAEGVPVLQVLSGTLFNPKISSILHTPYSESAAGSSAPRMSVIGPVHGVRQPVL